MLTAVGRDIFDSKYAYYPGEGYYDACDRVAHNIGGRPGMYDALASQRFIPAGRIWAWAKPYRNFVGKYKNVTLANCFTSGIIEDSFVDENGIMDRAKEAAATMRMGGGIGYDFSTLRPKGALIRKLNSESSGPLSFMRIFNEICLATCSSGHRRGAQMAFLRVDHPDILDFIHAKTSATNGFKGFNFSVAVTDEFMAAVKSDSKFDLQFNGEVYRTVRARELWDEIMLATWEWAEPGVVFIDKVNQMNNLYYCEDIVSSNPCGEQFLPPHGICMLGAFNLAQYVTGDRFNYSRLEDDVALAVEAYTYLYSKKFECPLPEQAKVAQQSRRMGLGVMGVSTALHAMGFDYGEEGFLLALRTIMTAIRDTAYDTSSFLARSYGSFPQYDREKYLAGQFIRTLPSHVRNSIADNGIASSHLTTVAPTGTTSILAGNVSSGIEPIFHEVSERVINFPDGQRRVTIRDYGLERGWGGGREVKVSGKCSIKDHMRVLDTVAELVDSGVSKTCIIGDDIDFDEFKNIYMMAYDGCAKGCTTFRPSGRLMGVVEKKNTSLCTINDNGERECG